MKRLSAILCILTLAACTPEGNAPQVTLEPPPPEISGKAAALGHADPALGPLKAYLVTAELRVHGQPVTLSRIAVCSGWRRYLVPPQMLIAGWGRPIRAMGKALADGSAVALRHGDICPVAGDMPTTLPDDQITLITLDDAANPTRITAYPPSVAPTLPDARITLGHLIITPAPQAQAPDDPGPFAWLDQPADKDMGFYWRGVLLHANETAHQPDIANLRTALHRPGKAPFLMADEAATLAHMGQPITGDGPLAVNDAMIKLVESMVPWFAGARHPRMSLPQPATPAAAPPVPVRLENGDNSVAFDMAGSILGWRDKAMLASTQPDPAACKVRINLPDGRVAKYPFPFCLKLKMDGHEWLINSFSRLILFPQGRAQAYLPAPGPVFHTWSPPKPETPKQASPKPVSQRQPAKAATAPSRKGLLK